MCLRHSQLLRLQLRDMKVNIPKTSDSRWGAQEGLSSEPLFERNQLDSQLAISLQRPVGVKEVPTSLKNQHVFSASQPCAQQGSQFATHVQVYQRHVKN